MNWILKRWGVWGVALSLTLYGLSAATLLILLLTWPLAYFVALWVWGDVTCVSEPPTALNYQQVVRERSAKWLTLYPQWTPDGKRVVFAFREERFVTFDEYGGNPVELHVADVEKREVSRIPASQMKYSRGHHMGPSPSDATSPSVHPQGDLVAYATASHIETASLDGSEIAALAGTENIDVLPEWDTSGDRLAFISYFADKCRGVIWTTTVVEPEGVYTMKPDGTDARRIVDLDLEIIESKLEDTSVLRWSSDGRRLSFVGIGKRDGGERESAVYVVDRDGANLRKLFASSETDGMYIATGPAWSPDGQRIAFLGYDGEKMKIYSVSEDGLRMRAGPDIESDFGPIDIGSVIDRFGQVAFDLSWSLDGSRIRFSAHGAVYTANADGSGVRALFSVPELERAYYIARSPDNSRIAILDPTMQRGDVLSVMRLDAPGELDVIIKWSKPGEWRGGFLEARPLEDGDSPQR